MPAAVAKGIIISLSIITALSVAVLENPQVQAWLEQQRQRIAELLRSIGEDLDPQSRRTAEAFAYEGRTPATDPGLRREVDASMEAVASATGRSLSNASTIRRIPIQGPTDPDTAAERRAQGRAYLAKRNQEMIELRARKRAARAEAPSTPTTPTSFDDFVDDQGMLKLVDNEKKEKELPSPPASELIPEAVKDDMREVERQLTQPLLEGVASSSTAQAGWSFGSIAANPFSDEFAMDRSSTPKPPVPPKVALEVADDPPISIPGSFTPRAVTPQPQPQQVNEDLSYEEQLAIALSLSEEEATKSAVSNVQQHEDDDAELRAAIEASLKEMKTQPAASASEPETSQRPAEPLVDLTPPSPTLRPYQPVPRGRWETLFDQELSPNRGPLSLASQSEDGDELYRVTPEFAHVRPAPINSPPVLPSSSSTSPMPYDPVRDAAQQQSTLEASFYSATSSVASPASSQTMDHEPTPQLVDVSEDPLPDGARTPTSRPSGFQSETDSDTDTWASMSAPASRAQSRARSEISNVEVIDVEEDSDVDMLSEEGDGIATPDSWSEIGSRDGDSEMEDEQPRRIPVL